MRSSSFAPSESIGTFAHIATSSFYGTEISPPLELKVSYEMHRGRPVFREAIDQRGVSHEIELLNQGELRNSFRRTVAGPVLTAE